jgi:hypothetical protein
MCAAGRSLNPPRTLSPIGLPQVLTERSTELGSLPVSAWLSPIWTTTTRDATTTTVVLARRNQPCRPPDQGAGEHLGWRSRHNRSLLPLMACARVGGGRCSCTPRICPEWFSFALDVDRMFSAI